MKLFLTIVITCLVFSSCQENKTQSAKQHETETSKHISEKPVLVSNQWMRPGSKNRNTAAFMSITNNMEVDDTLYSVESNLAKVVELHESYEKENDMMGMRHVDFIVIPSKSTVELKPGSFHIMLIGLNNDLVKGNEGILIANFKKNGKVELPLSVRTVGK